MTTQMIRVRSGKFDGGALVMTTGVNNVVAEGKLNPISYLTRHFNGDWGDLGKKDKEENELSLKEGFRILSAYVTPAGKIWIITEADRSVTTILFPEEY